MRGGSTRGCRLDRSGPGCGLAILLLAAGAGEVRAAAEVTSEPATLVAGQVSTARLTIRGAGLGGALGAAVSEGQVRAVTGVGSDVVVDYALAAGAHPRRLCLLVWGDPGSGGPAPQVVVLRVPVHGRTTIPVRTRRNSSVEVRVADRTFGPVSTGQRGRASVEVLVPPGVSQAAVEVTDQDGLRSSR